MKVILIWVVISFSPQGEEVAQSVHLTRAECQASLSGFKHPARRAGQDNVRRMQERGDHAIGDIKGESHEAKCVQYSAER